MTETIVGLFHSPEDARQAATKLEDMGIGHDRIGLVGSNAQGQHGGLLQNAASTGQNVASGVEVGALAGGATGFLLGAVALALPVVGPVITAGVLAATLTGAGIGAVAGGLIGALVHAGVPADIAPRLAEGVRQGGTVVTVHTEESQAAAVRSLFTQYGAATELPLGEFHDIPDSEKISGEPLHFGPTGARTQVSEDPINEISIGEESQAR